MDSVQVGDDDFLDYGKYLNTLMDHLKSLPKDLTTSTDRVFDPSCVSDIKKLETQFEQRFYAIPGGRLFQLQERGEPIVAMVSVLKECTRHEYMDSNQKAKALRFVQRCSQSLTAAAVAAKKWVHFSSTAQNTHPRCSAD